MLLHAFFPELPFSEAAALYLSLREVDARPGASHAQYIRGTTLRSYRQYARSLNLFFGAIPLREIHLGHWRSYQALRAAGEPPFVRRRRPHEEPGPCPAKARQINQELALLRVILRRALCWTAEMEHYAEDLREDGAEVPRALTPEQQARWIEVSRSNPRWEIVHWYSLLAFETTCSTNELRGLRIGDCSVRNQMIDVPWASAKNRYRCRSVAVEGADALWALERLLSRAAELGACSQLHYLFPFRDSRSGQYDASRPMTVSGLKRRWEEVRTASGLGWFRCYDTRHTAITRLAERGVPIEVIKARAGHVSDRMSQHYTHISLAAQRRWMQQPLMPGPVAPRPQPPYAPHWEPRPHPVARDGEKKYVIRQGRLIAI